MTKNTNYAGCGSEWKGHIRRMLKAVVVAFPQQLEHGLRTVGCPLIIACHWKIWVNMFLEHFHCLDDNHKISFSTLCDMYSSLREVCEVIWSNSELLLGGPGCTVEADETFLTKRKYHRERIIETHSITFMYFMSWK